MVLDNTFNFWAGLIVALLIPFYIYRKQIKEFIVKDGKFEEFLLNIRKYIRVNHPKIMFDFSIVNKTKEEKNITLRETLIVENLSKQFIYYTFYIPTFMPNGNTEALGKNYYLNSKPQKNGKVPKDWPMRKEQTWIRDGKKCQRCGIDIRNLESVNIYFLKSIKDGGEYNFENLMTLCNDCNLILTTKDEDKEKLIQNTSFYENLMKFVE